TFWSDAIAIAAGPTIQLLNPTQGTTPYISDKNDGTDTAYHIVAAVSTVPANPAAEFEFEDADGTRTSVTATRVGASDTWEAFFDIPGSMADGTYTLRAVLFSGPSEVARDEEETGHDRAPGSSSARRSHPN
ncbi:MAG: hypothetical protein LC808_22880, partial [Actinobacteria bacterium]|nr:hypothetical protein [Actinomycetota bacterium]